MFFDSIRRKAGVAGLVAAVALALPVLPASAGVPGQPTALTITPDFASRVGATETAAKGAAAGEIQVAQNRDERRIWRRQQQRREARRDFRQDRRELRRERRADRRHDRRERRADRRWDRRHYRADRRWDRRHRHGGRWYYHYDNGWYDDNGAWVAAGVIGLAAGAIAGSALANGGYGYGGDTVVVVEGAQPYSAEWYRQCDQKYRSFRASDGTYLGYDGVRHLCRLP